MALSSPLPISIQTTGSLSAAGSVEASVDGMASVAATITGTWTASSVIFEVSADGITYGAIEMFGGIEEGLVGAISSSAAGNGVYYTAMGPFIAFRVRALGVITGTIDVAITTCALPTTGVAVFTQTEAVFVTQQGSPFTVLETGLSATATVTSVADSASSVTLLSLNALRRTATITNDSSAILYVKLGTTASLTSYTVRLVQHAYYELPTRYIGRIDGIWTSAPGDGAARITELT